MKSYRRGDVVWADIPSPSPDSHVQGGIRPWVIVQNNIGNRYSTTTIVIPMTTKKKRLDMPTHVPVTWGKLRPGIVECEQVRAVDMKEDWEYLCTLPPEIMVHIDNALSNAFFYGGGVNDGK